MKPSLRLFKNVSILINESQLDLLKTFIAEPANQWLEVSLQPIIEVDENGLIILFKPTHQMSMNLVFFIQNLMVIQRLFLMDEFLRKNGMIK